VDVVIISAEIGYQKPHKEAFDILFGRLGLAPGQVIFVDDSAKSLEKASEIGYIPILFKDNEQLNDDLRKLGIVLPASANHLH
jgi:FMN phosphatase YigB (HAD superfamily)